MSYFYQTLFCFIKVATIFAIRFYVWIPVLVQRAIMKKGDGCDHTVVKKLHFVNKIFTIKYD